MVKPLDRAKSTATFLRNNLSLTARSLKLAWETSRVMSLGVLVTGLMTALLPLAMAYAGKRIIDAIVVQSVDAAGKWIAIEFALVFAQSLLNRALYLQRTLLGSKLSLSLQMRILRQATNLEVAQFEDPEIYDKLNRASREASFRPIQMFEATSDVGQKILVLLGYTGILVSYNPWMLVAMLVAAIPQTVVEARFSNTVFGIQNFRTPKRRHLSYLEFILTRDSHVKEIKIFGLAKHLLGLYRSGSVTLLDEDNRLARHRAAWSSALGLLSDVAFYGSYLLLGLAAAKGALTLGNLTLYVVAFRQGQQALQSGLAATSKIYEHNLYMGNLFEFLNLPRRELKTPLPSTPAQTQGITFENVSFKYPDAKQFALRNLNFTIAKGQSIALVGQNGAGKTTFIKLLCRLYEPTEGRILLDGRDLREWEEGELRRRISPVFQDFIRYQLSFRDNVGLGKLEFLHNDERILQAARDGGALDVLSNLPEGLNNQLGRWFVDGAELSGGQWQKIALARAFMRQDADILILDEPTAALDATAEFAVFERFKELTSGRTSVIISHRFPTARLADLIVVIEGGQIIEQGTHAQLLEARGEYARMFTLQANGYT